MNQQISSKLNDLVQYLQDSRNGYRECADNVKSGVMKMLFNDLSNRRQNMINELDQAFPDLTNVYDKDGTVLGKAHQYFVNLKGTLTGGDVDSIINEVKRGENTLIDEYKDNLRETLPGRAQEILNKQMHEIEENIKEIDAKSANLIEID